MSFARPASLAHALDHLATEPRRILAGGTDIYPAHVDRPIAEPVLDISGLSELRAIKRTDTGFRIGALTRWSDLVHADLPPAFDGLKQAAIEVGSVQIQNVGTIAGNLCNASPAADSVPALVTAKAKVIIVGPGGTRRTAVENVVTGPGKTSLEKGEIIKAIVLPDRPTKASDAYLRFIPRTEMDIAVVGAGVNVTLDKDGTCTAARVALGAVAPTPLLVQSAADALIGTKIDDQAQASLASAASAVCRPIDDKRGTIEYRTKVAGVLAQRAAVIARDRALGVVSANGSAH